MNQSTAPRSSRLPLTAVLLVALAAGLGLWAGERWFASRASMPPTLAATALYPQPRVLPDFSLDGGDGQPLDAAALRGRWTLVFLGFTHCPDICPTTLAELGAVQKQLADLPEAQRPRLLFVSADPERDSPQRTAEYVRHFSADALGATADHARLERFVSSLGMVYMKSELANGDYTVDHSSRIAVFDPQVRLAGQIAPPLDVAKIAADLRQLGTQR
jgi:protein SCO1